MYDGQSKEGMSHGQGVDRFPNGSLYEGYWLKDKMHGDGELRWPNRSVYKSQWLEGKQHDQGVHRAYDCAVMYEGQYRLGKMHGNRQGV